MYFEKMGLVNNAMSQFCASYEILFLQDKKHERITCGIFYCRDSAETNGCGSLQTLSWFDSDVLRNRQQKHTANPLWASLKNDTAV